MWRDARIEDDRAIVAMCEALYEEDPPSDPVTADQMRRTLATLRREPVRGRALVLEIDGRPAGYAFLITFLSNELGGEICTIDEVYVVPAERGRGHTTALIDALAGSDAVALELEVSPDNVRARALYERLEFRARRNSTLRRRLR
jgi:ribosomal protein S18 acetylase RimI-like enzyme